MPVSSSHVEEMIERCDPYMRAFCRYTRKRFEPTHGDVLNLHTGVLLSLSSSSSLSVVLFPPPLPFPLPSLCLQSALCVSFVNDNDNDRSSSWLSVHMALTCPEGQSAAVAHSLLGEHVRHPERNNCPGNPVQATCHLE